MSTVFLNGEYLPKEEARISPDDRGFLLADGIYEVTSYYHGVAFGMERHMQRLLKGLCWTRIDVDTSGMVGMHDRLIRENGLEDEPTALVYLQITRGAAPRTHWFPTGPVEPTVYAFAKAWNRPSDEAWLRGSTAVTVPDRRWGRVDIKTICLLPNVMGIQAARDAGADDAILVKDGVAIEGTHQNFWGVFDGTLVTHPVTNHILPGITRAILLEVARDEGMPVEERPIMVEDLPHADELFFSGTTAEVQPCTEVDGRAVGDGTAGPVTRSLSAAFRKRIAESAERVRTAAG